MGLFGGVSLIKGRIGAVMPVEIKQRGINIQGIAFQIFFKTKANEIVIVPIKFLPEILSKINVDPKKMSRAMIENKIKEINEIQQRESKRYQNEKDFKKIKKFQDMSQKRAKLMQDLQTQAKAFQKGDIMQFAKILVGKKLRLVIK